MLFLRQHSFKLANRHTGIRGISVLVSREIGIGSMSKKERQERIASSLDRITDLCFTISELALEEEKEAKPSSSTLSAAASVFVPAKEETSTPADQGSDLSDSDSDDWESVPELSSLSLGDTPPTFSQVVGCGSQSVYVTPVSKVARARPLSVVATEMAAVPPAPDYANISGAQFDTYWATLPDDNARINAEGAALTHGNPEVKLAVLMKRDTRNTARLGGMAVQLAAAQAVAQQAQQTAATARAAAASPPPKWENKEKDVKIRQWIPLVEEYFRGSADADYLRNASSFLIGKPRSYWLSQYEAFRAANANQEPPQPRRFFSDTMIRGYGLRDPEQSYWDTWNKLSQGTMSVDEYNVQFQQATVDLNRDITDEQVKIEKYKSGLQTDLREMCRVSPQGDRWQNLDALMRYATLQWPTIEARLAKRRAAQPKSVAGKRKSSGGSPGKSSKARVSIAGLTDEQRQYNMEHRLCHKCGKPGHIAVNCTEDVSQNKGKGKNKGKQKMQDF